MIFSCWTNNDVGLGLGIVLPKMGDPLEKQAVAKGGVRGQTETGFAWSQAENKCSSTGITVL